MAEIEADAARGDLLPDDRVGLLQPRVEEGSAAIDRLRALGHRVGLHAVYPRVELDERFDPVVAWHNPDPEYMTCAARRRAQRDGARCGSTRHVPVGLEPALALRLPARGAPRGAFPWLQLLTHPEIWAYQGATMSETMSAMLDAERAWIWSGSRADRIDLVTETAAGDLTGRPRIGTVTRFTVRWAQLHVHCSAFRAGLGRRARSTARVARSLLSRRALGAAGGTTSSARCSAHARRRGRPAVRGTAGSSSTPPDRESPPVIDYLVARAALARSLAARGCSDVRPAEHANPVEGHPPEWRRSTVSRLSWHPGSQDAPRPALLDAVDSRTRGRDSIAAYLGGSDRDGGRGGGSSGSGDEIRSSREHAEPITVVVTASGAPGTAALLRGLRENGEREVRLVGTDMSERSVGRHLCDAFHLVPAGSDPGFADAIRAIVEREGADCVLPQSSFDLEGLAEHRDTFPVPVLVSKPDTIFRSNDKAETYAFLHRLGAAGARRSGASTAPPRSRRRRASSATPSGPCASSRCSRRARAASGSSTRRSTARTSC